MHNKCIEKGSPEVNDLKDCPSIVLCLCRVAMDSMIAMNPMATMSPTVAMNPRLQERKDARMQQCKDARIQGFNGTPAVAVVITGCP